MASIVKHKDKWRVHLYVNGIRKSGTFATKKEARDWAAVTEAALLQQKSEPASGMTFRELLERYVDEVSAAKRGEEKERIRLGAIARMPIADVKLKDLNETHIAEWRDARLRTVAGSTVNREWTLLNSAINIAIREWRLMARNPMANVRRPKNPPPRDRRVAEEEIERLCIAAGYAYPAAPSNTSQRVVLAFLFAIETGMRAGEILGLRPEDVNFEKRTAHLPKTKNGTARTVPLTRKAVEILQMMPAADTFFNMTPAMLDAMFRKLRRRGHRGAALPRHEA